MECIHQYFGLFADFFITKWNRIKKVVQSGEKFEGTPQLMV
jgi:hypothetical protein